MTITANVTSQITSVDVYPEYVSIHDSPLLTAPKIATAYDIPYSTGAGVKVGIISLGGGFNQSDLNLSMADLGITAPTITFVPVNGATNTTVTGTNEDSENILDLVCVAGMVPQSNIVLYKGQNTLTSFGNAIQRAVDENCDVISISWGGTESTDYLATPLQNASVKGITVLASAGDYGSSATGGSIVKVLYPASSANVLAVGGTFLTLNTDNSRNTESTYNNNEYRDGYTPAYGYGIGGGGGVSSIIPLPTWQTGQTYQQWFKSNSSAGPVTTLAQRGVPDVALAMNRYGIRLNGAVTGASGTSASAPIMAGIVARLRAINGGKFSSAQLNSIFYKNSNAFYDILTGNDASLLYTGYVASTKWDPVTGMGVPIGTAIAELLTSAVTQTPTLTWSQPANLSVTIGANVTNTVTSTLTGGSYGAITYTSSDPTVATVDSATGTVFGKALGTITITAAQAAVQYVNYSATNQYTLTVEAIKTGYTKYGKGITYIKNGPGSGYWSAVRHAWIKNADGTWHPIIRGNLKVGGTTWESVYPTPQGIPFLSDNALSFNPYQYHTQPDNDLDGDVNLAPTTVSLTNTGDYDLVITAIVKNDTAGYQTTLTTPRLPLTLLPTESTTIGVRVKGLTVGTTTGNILIYSDTGVLGQVANVVPVSVQVRPDYSGITVSPNPIRLTYYVLESPATQTVTIKNSGNGANLNIYSNSISGGRATVTTVPTRLGYNFNTFSGNSATVTVTAANLAVGTYTDTLTLGTDSTDTQNLAVPIIITVLRPKGRQVFDAGGTYTWTVPDHVHRIDVLAVGAGGGGGPGVTGVLEGGSGGAGGSGAYQQSSGVAVTPGETLTITVGNGGNKSTYSSAPYYAVSNGAWSGFMNSYAVWTHPDGVSPTNQVVSSRRIFTSPAAGYYTIAIQADNNIDFYIDEVAIASTNSFTSSTTANVYLHDGNRKLTFNVTNYGGPAGFAVLISDANGSPVWNTRTLLDPAAGGSGGTTIISGSFGTISANPGVGGGAAYNSGSVSYGDGNSSTGDADSGQTDGGGGGGGCFLPHTLIRMADGTEKRISQIQPGDYVLEALTNRPSQVIGVKTRAHDVNKWVFALHDDEMPYITEEHPWYNDDDELCAISTLCTEQAPWLGDIKIVDVKNKIKLTQEVIVYNLILETGESHYANGIRVNNIVKNGGTFVLVYKGLLSQEAYQNHIWNEANATVSPAARQRFFAYTHKLATYVLENDNFKSRKLGQIMAWAVNNRSRLEPIAQWWFKSSIRKLIFGKQA